MGTPIIILAGQSNAGRISSEIIDTLDAAYGSGQYVLVRAWSSGAPLTSARDSKDDWQTPKELRTAMADDTVQALQDTPDGYVAGVLWVQGEADTDQSGTPADYGSDFHALFDELRAEVADRMGNRATGIENAPIIIANLSDHAPEAPNRANWTAIQAELDRLDAGAPNIVTVDPDEMAADAGVAPGAMFTDGLHYSDAASLALAAGLVGTLLDVSAPDGPDAPDGPGDTGGAETLQGSSGDDLYEVDHVGDVIIEAQNAGHDLVRASVSFALRDHGHGLEDLTLLGTANLSGTGNAADNVLTGNAGNNALNGAWGDDLIRGLGGDDTLQDTRGTDTLIGGPGNDVYHVDSEEDEVIELAGEGHDRIISSVSFRLWADAPNVEDLELVGGDLMGAGNALDNRIFGTGGDNFLDGARGDDWLQGGGGADTLHGQDGADTLLGGAGSDVLIGDSGSADETFASGQAFRLYQATLGRAPDAGGFSYWTDRLAAGDAHTDIVGGFVKSLEFRAVYGVVTDSEFIELLYNNVLGRGSDAAGKAGWLGHLDRGASREFVVAHFAESPEFKGMTAEDMQAWMHMLGGGDVLDPGAGDSTLTGGNLADSFVFGPGSDGTHLVTDYEAWDFLDLSAYDYADTDAALAHFTQQGQDLVFDDSGATVILEAVSLADLNEASFIL